MKIEKKENIISWSIVGAALAYFAFFTFIPLFIMLFYSFTNKVTARTAFDFVWFKNYATIFTDKEYYMPFLRTAFIGAFTMSISFVVGFVVACLLNTVVKGRMVFRTIWYIPVVVSMAVMSQIVKVVLNVDGTINYMVRQFGGTIVDWYSSAPWMYFWIIIICIWKGLGGTIILFLAGLQGVPQELYEAAGLDGAGRFQRTVYVTLPCMRNIMMFVLITGMIGAFNLFEPVQLISGGNPQGQTRVVLLHIYEEAFISFDLGMSNALSATLMALLIVLTVISRKLNARKS
jgi:ABC-type sugar transport system permease subunit